MARNVQFYGSMNKALGGDPIQRDYAQDPRRLMAQQLMRQGSSTAPVQSPLEGLTRALSGVAGGYFGGQAQRDMEERELARNVAINQVIAGGNAKQYVNPDTGDTTIQQDGIAAGPGDVPTMVQTDKNVGGYAGMQAALANIDNPDIASFRQNVAMGEMQERRALEAAELARAQKIAALKEQRIYDKGVAETKNLAAIELKGSPDGKKQPPKTVNTKEGVYILNDDGTLGERLGSPTSQFGFGLPPNLASNQPETTALRSNIPIAPITPWVNIPLRDQGKAKIAARTNAQQTIKLLQKSAFENSKLTQHAKRFQYLNTLANTGGLADRLTNVSQDPSKREMFSIIQAATPLMRQGLPGAASERDTAMFQGGFAGLDKTKEINDNITNAIIIRSNNEEDYMNFLQEYLTQNGHLDQANQYWGKYSEANPIFDKNAAVGSYTLNKDRKSYKEFFAPSPTLPEGITEEDIQQTMIEENVTRAQVLEFIGAK